MKKMIRIIKKLKRKELMRGISLKERHKKEKERSKKYI